VLRGIGKISQLYERLVRETSRTLGKDRGIAREEVAIGGGNR